MKIRIFLLAILLCLHTIVSASDASILRVKILNSAPRYSAKNTPSVLRCEKPAGQLSMLQELDSAMSSHGIIPSQKGIEWLKEAFTVYGYGTAVPAEKSTMRMALRTLELARRDNLVAAKMANDEAAINNPIYKASRFFWDMDRYIRNNSIPNAPEGDEKLNPHEVWLNKAAAGVMRSKQVLGSFYDTRATRFYVLGKAYDDGIAVEAATKLVCGAVTDVEVRDAISKVGATVATTKPEL